MKKKNKFDLTYLTDFGYWSCSIHKTIHVVENYVDWLNAKCPVSLSPKGKEGKE